MNARIWVRWIWPIVALVFAIGFAVAGYYWMSCAFFIVTLAALWIGWFFDPKRPRGRDS